ncbi:hypothetical protein DL95DRAFT_83313 [Leptodontidium sp. 2 PMI_412]|nr:hypothetical protein DL95DRAFT_83313 [Leptodontidium sp. 2 PMI_412]
MVVFVLRFESVNQSISQSRERERDFCPNPCTVQKCNAVRAVFLKTSLVVFVSLPFHSPCLALPHPMFTWDARNTNCLALPCPALLCLIIGNTTPLDLCSFPSLRLLFVSTSAFNCSFPVLCLFLSSSLHLTTTTTTTTAPHSLLPANIKGLTSPHRTLPHLLPTTAHCIRSACAM